MIRILINVVTVSCISLASLAIADVKIPDDRHIGFSGIEYHVPRNTRMTLYKYKADKNRDLSEVSVLEAQTRGLREDSNALRTVQGIDGDVVADCSIAIGNDTQTDIFAPKEQVVIIEGDVVNLGNCDQ